MQDKYIGYIKTERKSDITETFFFRDNTPIEDLEKESAFPFKEYVEPLYNIQQPMFDIELDEQEECGESCEPF